jgi:hypothetical protein
MRRHQSDASFTHYFIADHHVFIKNLPVVLTGNLEVSDAAAVSKEQKDVLWRSRLALTRARCYHEPAPNYEQDSNSAAEGQTRNLVHPNLDFEYL